MTLVEIEVAVFLHLHSFYVFLETLIPPCCLHFPPNHYLHFPTPFIFSQTIIFISLYYKHHLNLSFLRHRCWKLNSTLRCSSSSEKHHTNSPNSDDVIELPLFPLPLVLFPSAILLLQIFEFRYRIMMHTLLQTDLCFRVIYTNVVSRTAAVGCVDEVIKHESLVDERFFLIYKGQERFRVNNVVRTKPYLVTQVTWLEDRPSPSTDLDLNRLATEVQTYMKDVIRLSNYYFQSYFLGYLFLYSNYLFMCSWISLIYVWTIDDREKKLHYHHFIVISAFLLCAAWLDSLLQGGERER
ncbi:uncharacterized protein LOC124825550 [Vigna umbellata]|uniref:uncharacterized protein LOC124825550 n=1 Tax=Vigna umbellata TaxID=87088 RepID=UPI001F5FEB5B|nr:uncharacterized protein LOC124825550 [Vigna umbellata]